MGTSLLTNQSAMNALQTLRAIGNNLDTTQRRVSTGLRINEASDDTAYWSISSMMKSDRNALSAVSSAMALGKSQIDIAYQSTEKMKGYLDNIQKSLTTAYEKGPGDIQKIQNDIKASVTNIKDAVYSANMAEKNILANGGQTVNIAGAYRREGSAVYVDMIGVGGADLNFAKPGTAAGQYDLDKGQLSLVFGNSINKDGSVITGANEDIAKALVTVLAAQATYDAETDKNKEIEVTGEGGGSTSKTTPQQTFDKALNKFASDIAGKITVTDFTKLDFSTTFNSEGKVVADGTGAVKIGSQVLQKLVTAVQGNVTQTISNVVTAGASLGAAKNQVEGQIDFVSKLMDAIDKGVGALIDADMNAESARLASLQVQQQLGIQALSIANQNSQNILALFRQ